MWGISAVAMIALAIWLLPATGNPLVAETARFLSGPGNLLFLGFGYLGLVIHSVRARAWGALHVTVGALLAVTLVVQLQKAVFGAWLLRPSGHLGGFPSGHAAAACALAFLIALFAPRWAIAGYAAAIGISWSRVVVGAHWPYQVLAGAITGYLVVLWLSDRLAWQAQHHAIIARFHGVLVIIVPAIATICVAHEYENTLVVFLGAATLVLGGAAIHANRIFTFPTRRWVWAGGGQRMAHIANTLICAGITLGSEVVWLVPLSVLVCVAVFALVERHHRTLSVPLPIEQGDTAEVSPVSLLMRLRALPMRDRAWVPLLILVVLKELLW